MRAALEMLISGGVAATTSMIGLAAVCGVASVVLAGCSLTGTAQAATQTAAESERTAAASATTSSKGAMPTPATITGKPVSGQIVAKEGQVIENLHVTTTRGSCIVIKGVSHVTIRD